MQQPCEAPPACRAACCRRYLCNTPVNYHDHALDWVAGAEDALLLDNVLHMRICDTGRQGWSWQCASGASRASLHAKGGGGGK